MEMTLLSITVLVTHFLFASAVYFNTLPTSTVSDYKKHPQITEATAETNSTLRTLIKATALSPTTATQDSRITTSLPSAQDTHASLSSSDSTTKETASTDQFITDAPTQNDTMHVTEEQDGSQVSNASNVVMIYQNIKDTTPSPVDTTVSSNFARLTTQIDDNNETGTWSSEFSTSYSSEGHGYLDTQTANRWDTRPVTQPFSDPFQSAQTVPWTEKHEGTKPDEGNYEMSSTQATFANSNEETRGTQTTEGSYAVTTELQVAVHIEEHYNTTTNTTDASSATQTMRNIRIMPQDIPITTPVYTTVDLTVINTSENHTSIAVLEKQSDRHHTEAPNRDTGIVNYSTTQQSRDIFTNTTAYTEIENRTETYTLDTPSGTINNTSVITNVFMYNSTNATTITANKTDTENKLWPECFNTNSDSQYQRQKLVCFITVWILAMTATVFLGITIFLWVRVSVVKERLKEKGIELAEKGGRKSEKDSLWANPKTSVQERVEFWYVNGSTLEADRKEKERKKKEKSKKKRQEQNNSENELWIQPRVTLNDITEFWYANRRTKDQN